jgi:hypothetical protein
MGNSGIGPLLSKVVTLIADTRKDLGDLTLSVTAQRLALCELFPTFEARYTRILQSDPEISRVRGENEQKILALLAASEKLSVS